MITNSNSSSNVNSFNRTVASNSSVSAKSQSNLFGSKASVSASNVSAKSSAQSSVAPKSSAAGHVVPLEDRTKIEDVNNSTRNIYITEADGTKIYAQLQAPSFRQAERINDARYKMNASGGNNATLTFNTPGYQEEMFPMFHNLTVNNRPAGHMSWRFIKTLDWPTASWILGQADSFLTNLENANK